MIVLAVESDGVSCWMGHSYVRVTAFSAGYFRGFCKGKSFIHRFPVFVSAFARLMMESLVRTLNLICNF